MVACRERTMYACGTSFINLLTFDLIKSTHKLLSEIVGKLCENWISRQGFCHRQFEGQYQNRFPGGLDHPSRSRRPCIGDLSMSMRKATVEDFTGHIN